jgi:hypothetical protein
VHDIDDALGALQYCVEAKGRQYHSEAMYVDLALQPCCMVGMAWSVAGVTQEQLVACGTSDVMRLELNQRLPMPMTTGAVLVYDEAQRVQDHGDNWGAAYDAAVEVAKIWETAPKGELIDA